MFSFFFFFLFYLSNISRVRRWSNLLSILTKSYQNSLKFFSVLRIKKKKTISFRLVSERFKLETSFRVTYIKNDVTYIVVNCDKGKMLALNFTSRLHLLKYLRKKFCKSSIWEKMFYFCFFFLIWMAQQLF